MSTTTQYKTVHDGEPLNTATATVIHEELVNYNDAYEPGFEHCRQLCLTPNGTWFLMVRNEPFLNTAIKGPDLRDYIKPIAMQDAADLLLKFGVEFAE